MGRKIAILMDSSCSVPDEFVGEDIYVVPMYVHLKDKSYKDILEISSRQLKEKIEKEDIIAKTSIPSIGDIKEYIEKIKSDGYTDIIAISVSSGLSGLYNAFNMAASDEKDINIKVFDTKNVAFSSAFFALYTQELIKEKKNITLDEIYDELNNNIKDSKLFICLDTLKYLIAGGRVGKVAGSLGTLLKIMPIITCDDDGVYETVGKVRSIEKATIDICTRIKEFVEVKAKESKKNIYLSLVYRDDDKVLKKMEDLLRNEISSAVKYIKCELTTPTVGVHSGFGVMAVGAFCF